MIVRLLFGSIVLCTLLAASLVAETSDPLGEIGMQYPYGSVYLDVYPEHVGESGWAYYTGSFRGRKIENLTAIDPNHPATTPPEAYGSEPIATIGLTLDGELIFQLDVYPEHLDEGGWAHYSGSYAGEDFDVWFSTSPEDRGASRIPQGG